MSDQTAEFFEFLNGYLNIIYQRLDPKIGVISALVDYDLEKDHPVIELMASSVKYEVVMILARIFDKTRHARSLYKFQKWCASNWSSVEIEGRQLDRGFPDALAGLLNENAELIDRITMWRNKTLAHFDKAFFGKKTEPQELWPISFVELIQLTSDTQTLLAGVAMKLRQTAPISMGDVARAATFKLMSEDLRKTKQP